MESIANNAPLGPQEANSGLLLQPRRLLFITDIIGACLGGLLFYVVVAQHGIASPQVKVAAIMAAVIIVFTLALLMRSGQYANRRRLSPFSDAGAVARDLAISAAAAALLSYLSKGFITGDATPSRLAVGTFVLTFFVLGVVSRVGLNAYQRRLFARGRTVRKILLLGTGASAADFLEFLHKRPWLGVVVAGRLAYGPLDAAADETGSGPESFASDCSSRERLLAAHLTSSLLGFERLDQVLRVSGAVEVVVALDSEDQAQLPDVARLLSLAHVPFKVVPSLFEHSYRATELLGYSEIPVIDVAVDPLDRVARFFKRAMDVCGAATAVILLSPLALVIALAIMVESGLPVIYKQERLGKNGAHFKIYKFRSMVVDAESRLEELRSRDEGDGPHFKMASDPRLTRVGSFLRTWSLDELPQFVNVLQGEMSLVGPRPPLPREVEKYETSQLIRLKGKPGMTGLWQVSGRKTLTFDDMVKLDRHYLDNWSLRLDASILLRTLFSVVTRRGAY